MKLQTYKMFEGDSDIYVERDDVSVDLEHVSESAWGYIHKSVERFSLWEIWTFACKGVAESVADNTFPLALRDDHNDFSSLSADVGEKNLLLGFLFT